MEEKLEVGFRVKDALAWIENGCEMIWDLLEKIQLHSHL